MDEVLEAINENFYTTIKRPFDASYREWDLLKCDNNCIVKWGKIDIKIE